jgi:hypothetical protein
MGKKDGAVGTTPQQAELLKIAQFQAQRYAQTELPAIKQFGEQIKAAHAPGSFERNRSLGQASSETAAAFGQAEQQADRVAASRGQLGSAAHKLGAVDIGADAAATTGLGAVAANQSAEDAYVNGLGRMVGIGRGKEAAAVSSTANAADISGRQAADAAQRSLQSSIGTAGLVGQGLGTAGALWLGSSGTAPNTDDYRGTELPQSLRGGR